ncbi:MAG: hypothetical protein GY830_02045 [Bacteroidetes bacterium]|nr:hypothetical protein [Bacteroidota bacterium]
MKRNLIKSEIKSIEVIQGENKEISDEEKKLINEPSILGQENIEDVLRALKHIKILERCSGLFISHLALLQKSGFCSISRIIDEIKVLEGLALPNKVKSQAPFKRKWLKGLYHKHFYTDRHLSENIKIHWDLKGINKNNKNFEDLMKPFIGKDISEVAGQIAQSLVMKPFEERVKTGDWIIYAKHQGKNYYLDIGKHGEDENIYNRIQKNCKVQFPFLKDILKVI